MEAWLKRRSEWMQRPDDSRSPWDVDYARIIHSFSFRRLQGKTQILNLGDSDFYRTRLTHSLEVANIAASIARQIKSCLSETHLVYSYLPDPTLVQTIGLSHDIGHPPFGHGGEVALNYCMRDYGGFEGNAQTLRILARLEDFSENSGADLSRRALLGVIKYPIVYSKASSPDLYPELNNTATSLRFIDRDKSTPPKCYHDVEQDIFDWIQDPFTEQDKQLFSECIEVRGKHSKTIHKSLDCSIMDLADDIAYGVHDLEDAIALNLITEAQFREDVTESKCVAFLDTLSGSRHFSNDIYDVFVKFLFGEVKKRKQYFGKMVHQLITHADIEEIEGFEHPLLRYRVILSKGFKKFLDALKMVVFKRVIRGTNVQHLEFKGQKMVVSVFEAIESDPMAFLPDYARAMYEQSSGDKRIICDYIAGMTDAYLLKTYDRMFSPRMGSVFERL